MSEIVVFTVVSGKIMVSAQGLTCSEYCGPLDVLFTELRKTYAKVFTTGTLWNADLILQLYRRCGDRCTILVAGPNTHRENASTSADSILQRLKRCKRRSSTGGWIVVNAAFCDVLRYMTDSSVSATTLPFWPGLSFLTPEPPPQLRGIMQSILDPRWFLREGKPGYVGIHTYLRLTPRHICAVLAGDKSPKYSKCSQVLDMVYNGRDEHSLLVMREGVSRIARDIIQSSTSDEVEALRSTRALVNFLVRVWHNSLYAVNHPHMTGIFDPQLCFKQQDAEAWLKHTEARLG